MATFIKGSYVQSESIRIQGSTNKAYSYQRRGYVLLKNLNGYLILGKPAELRMTFEENNKRYTFNMKDDVCEIFNRQKISEALANKFIKDVEKGKFVVNIDPNGLYTIR